MRRIFVLCLALVAAASLVAAAGASAKPKPKSKKEPAPQITRVTPMRVSVGGSLTVRGRNFKPQRAKNTVIFRGPTGRAAFVKPRRASRTKLVVPVPAAVARLVTRDSGAPKATRFKLRVLAGRFSKFTPRRLSPVVVPANRGSSGPAAPGGVGTGTAAGCPGDDFDGDLLSAAFEAQLRLDPCLADTDLDGIADGYEYQSAVDLNHYPRTPPLPYPGKRPYPNPLDPGDAGTDYDGDSLLLGEEFTLWTRYSSDGVPRVGRPTTLSGLLYSDGLQKSIDPPPAAPPLGTLANWVLELYPDGQLWDDERDADADGLSNWDESHGRMVEDWWPSTYDGDPLPRESQYPDRNFLDNADLPNRDAPADPDVDGDGVLDGADDYDGDGLSNQFEVHRPADYADDAFDPGGPGPNPWAYVNPFNPCKPFRSERCHRDVPFGYYDGDELPPIGPNVPPGYPGGAPVTPDN